MSVYQFTVKDNKGQDVSLSQYEGKVLLIVNTATKCGLTPQYDALQALYDKYRDQGLEILDFPCNQFLRQAPGDDEEIDRFCKLTYNTTFPRFAKVEVNGDKADPLFVYLKKQAPESIKDAEAEKFEKKVKPLTLLLQPEDIRWNFGKFLVDRKGNVVSRYSPGCAPETLEADIQAQV